MNYPFEIRILFCRPVRYTYHRGEFVKDDGKVFIFGLRDIYGVKKCRTESINPFEPGKGVNLI